jgi:hypothetical protein
MLAVDGVVVQVLADERGSSLAALVPPHREVRTLVETADSLSGAEVLDDAGGV